MHACTSFALRGNGHVIHSDNNKSFEGVNLAESICDVMTSNPRSLESGSSAVDAARLMRDEDVGIVPIVEARSSSASLRRKMLQCTRQKRKLAKSSRTSRGRRHAVPAECPTGGTRILQRVVVATELAH